MHPGPGRLLRRVISDFGKSDQTSDDLIAMVDMRRAIPWCCHTVWRTKEGQNEITVASIIIVLFTLLSLPVGKTKFLYAKTFFPIDEILLYDFVVYRVFKKDAPLLDDGFHPELNLFVTYSVLIDRSWYDFARY